MNKHAFLIMCHKNIEQVCRLVNTLDDERVDIFIHWDRQTAENLEIISKAARKSRVYLHSRYADLWGNYDFVKCEMLLVREALNKDNYEYIHLISGADLPIKPINVILDFFNTHNQYNFVCVEEDDDWNNKMIRERLGYYFGRISRYNSSNRWNKLSIAIQKKIGIDRLKKCKYDIKYGTNWFSIKPDFAKYILESSRDIKKIFNRTLCPDEFVVNTLAYNSDFKNTLYLNGANQGVSQRSVMRLIDWKRGNPYVFRKTDYEDIINSEFLFARKFDTEVDAEIVDMICRYVTSET